MTRLCKEKLLLFWQKIAKKYKKKTYAVTGKAKGDFSSYFERIYEVMKYADSQI